VTDDALQLDSSPPPVDETVVAARHTRANYKKPLAAYEATFGVKPNEGRTIKRWIKIGREKKPEPDLPPLDDPPSMATWWSRNMKHRVPVELLTLADAKAPTEPAPSRAGGEPEATVSVGKGAVPEKGGGATSDQSGKPGKLHLPEGSGFAAALSRAQDSERAAYARWQEALTSDEYNAGTEEMRRRAWMGATELVRKLEKDAEEILGRDLIPWPEAEKLMTENLRLVNRSLRSLFVRVATKAGLSQDSFRKIEPVYQEELDRCFEELAGDDYEEAEQPGDEVSEDAPQHFALVP
jgi:hypothetical protein